MQAITIFQMIYGIPSLCLMCFFFCLPFVDRKNLSNPFYRLVQIDIFVNITCYINSWLAIRLEYFEIGRTFLIFLESSLPGCLTLSKLFVSLYFHLQNVTGLFLVIYRFTSVYSINSEKVWNRWYFLVPVLGLLYSFIIISPWWLFQNYVTRVRIIDGKLIKIVNQRALLTQASINPYFSAFYFLLIILIGVWTTVLLENRWKKSHSRRHNHFIKKLTRVIFCNSFLMSGNLLLLIATSVMYVICPFRTVIMKIQTIAVTFTSDMVTLAMPYILLAFDSNMRRILRIEKSKGYDSRTASNYAEN
ncbi:Serpentine receptor class gamma [Caenorhabditis elegans]|uniref:Serpentine receptor class gamma n=1 Tax=Caenorhabditis elegans TaxID=6239 RepID=Q86GB8_CAEEL|nr:Serpentine receptor class gamma [Caenorhabditis elegans]CAD60425.3 Serpentine receptor class gamma [Caenorhabditis elegans]|eukprot:NP_001346698.1 Serpentine receptor class gamma [Caenorhabditis elegans]